MRSDKIRMVGCDWLRQQEKKEKDSVGEVVTEEEEVKFQKTHSKDEDACHRLCLHVPGGIYPNLVVGKEEP